MMNFLPLPFCGVRAALVSCFGGVFFPHRLPFFDGFTHMDIFDAHGVHLERILVEDDQIG